VIPAVDDTTAELLWDARIAESRLSALAVRFWANGLDELGDWAATTATRLNLIIEVTEGPPPSA
jgi:hypothetical protein